MNSSVKKYGFLPRRQLCKIPNFISTYKIVSKHLSHDGHTPAYLWIISWFPYTELLFKCLLAIKKHVPHTNQNLQISVLSFPNCLRGNVLSSISWKTVSFYYKCQSRLHCPKVFTEPIDNGAERISLSLLLQGLAPDSPVSPVPLFLYCHGIYGAFMEQLRNLKLYCGINDSQLKHGHKHILLPDI